MAISFTCPFCNEAYNNLKEELIGKRVTCRNQNCRKIFVVKANVPIGAAASSAATPVIPAVEAEKPTAPVGTTTRQPIKPAPIAKPKPVAPEDAEAMALAAFTEEQKKPEVEIRQIPVTCINCDHHFQVDRDKEGKNVLCPECRTLFKVPLLKKEEAADWRKTDTRDHLKKDIVKPEGVTEKTSVSVETLEKVGALPKIQYEPLPMWVKVQRFTVAILLIAGISVGIGFLMKSRQGKTENKNITEAIKAIEKSEDGKALTDLQGGIYRLAAEERIRTIKTKGDLDEAVKFLNLARDRTLRGSDHFADRQAELVEIAVTFCLLGGDAEELRNETRLKWDEVQKQVRVTLEKIGDDELRRYGIRRIVRQLATDKEAWRAVDVAKQIFSKEDLPEIIGQIGLELLRVGQKEAAMEFLKKKVPPMVTTPADVEKAPSLTALRIALGSIPNPAPLNNLSLIPAPGVSLTEEGRQAYVDAFVFAGEYRGALDLANRPGVGVSRLRAYLNGAEKALIENSKEQALPFLDGAIGILRVEGKSPTISPWLKVRCLSLLARAGKVDVAGQVVETLEKEYQPWARVELLRGRLLAVPTEPAQEEWLPAVPEGTKPRLAHAVARELFARHQAANGLSIPVDNLSPLLKPFAQLATTLGSQSTP